MNKKGMKQSTKLSIDLISTIIVTLIAGAVTVAAVISVAWFANNRQTTSTGASVSVKGPRYEVLFLSEDAGKYYNEYHSALAEPGALIWKMTPDRNIKNNSGISASSEGIFPGDSGVISFKIRPIEPDVKLKYSFEIVGYSIGTENEDQLIALNEDTEPGIFLNGHIVLFEGCTEMDGKKRYSTPILSRESDGLLRTIEEKSYPNVGEEYQVDIYWVWPNTLSELINVPAEKTTVMPFIADYYAGDRTDYNAVAGDIHAYPQFYLRDLNENENVTDEAIYNNYDRYGDLYNRADNDIGYQIRYFILKMHVAEVLDNEAPEEGGSGGL